MNVSDALLFNSAHIPVIHCHRASVIDERRHRFNVTTPAERKARRKRLVDAMLLTILLGAFALIGIVSLPPQPGAVPVHLTAPGVTADNAPVRWQRKDFPAKPLKAKSNTSSPVRVAPASTTARRGFRKSPAPGSVSTRKGAAK